MNVSEKNEEAFGLVLNEISKSVLRTINKSEHEAADRIILGENDSTSIFVMGSILVRLCDQESDHKITDAITEIMTTAVVTKILTASALVLGESRIKAIVAEVRAKCTNQVLALQRAHTDIENGSTAEEALADIKELL